jgi:hypothetical protein
MLQIEDTIISLDLFDQSFCCDLKACKGICCVEGDEGAPVELDEIAMIEEILPQLWDKLSDNARKIIDNQGIAYIDREGEMAISIVNGAECVFAVKGENAIWSCLIEKLYFEGKITFRKPISCHLYPIRTKQFSTFKAVNYHKWQICKDAVLDGEKKHLLLYQYLKEPLIRKFGQDWYNQLSVAAEHISQ